MAAGLGYKEFTTGDVLTAADANGYLASQVVMVFADAAARTSAIASPQEGMFSFLKDTNATQFYDGAAWVNLDTTGMVNPMTTTGDVIYSSSGSTPARLGIGTAGQVLTVNSGATAPEWATPASTTLPAFSAYGSANQTPTVNVWTKVTMNTEVFDTASNFDTTDSRFLPTTAGYYQINGTLNMETSSSGAQLFAIYKNGTLDKYLSQQILSGESITSGSSVIYLNGSTDYVELYGRGTAGTVTFYAGITATTFTGVGVRP
jgi:hypothetical protein